LQSSEAEEAKEDLPLAHSERAWYCWPWQQIAWEGVISANKWLRQVVCAIESRGDKPLAHPTLQGINVTLANLNELKYEVLDEVWSQKSAESLRRNEYFAIYKDMFPGMALMFEEYLVQQPVDRHANLVNLERELLVRTPEAVEWATIAWDGRDSTDNWLRQLVAEIKMKGGRPLTHPVSGEDLTRSTVRRLKFGRVPQDSLESLRQNEYFTVYTTLFPDLARAHV
jgi:hypothetical protein